MAIKETDLAWAAGFVDGEGCITIDKQNSPKGITYRLCLSVCNTDIRSILKIHDIFDCGSLTPTIISSGRECLTWKTSSADTKRVLELLRPYLVIKGEQADAALKYETRIGKGNMRLEDVINRDAIYVELKDLKHQVGRVVSSQ